MPPEDALKFGDLELDPATLVLSTAGREIKLNLKEKELLELLIARKNVITPKDLIIDRLWGFDSEATENYVEVYISFLRKKLSFLESHTAITTLRGRGYRLEGER